MMRFAHWVILVLAFIATTAWLGWWTVPLVAGAWGMTVPYSEKPWWTALAAAVVAWTILLVVSALRGPIAELASVLGGVFALPAFAVILLTLAFAALLAWSAAGLTSALRKASA